jgi:hypothetical protein
LISFSSEKTNSREMADREILIKNVSDMEVRLRLLKGVGCDWWMIDKEGDGGIP